MTTTVTEEQLKIQVTHLPTDPKISPWGDTVLVFQDPLKPENTVTVVVSTEMKDDKPRFKAVKH
jgi:hypothetical protein